MTLFISALLLIQLAVPTEISELREYLGMNYRGVLTALGVKNQILLRNTKPLAPAQATLMQSRWKAPDRLPAERPVLSVGLNDIGQGLVSYLFEGDFTTEQVNFIFCPPQPATTIDGVAIPARGEQVLAVQVLFDESRAFGAVPDILQKVYRMPRPVAPYQPVLAYPMPATIPATFWNLGAVEAAYQPVPNRGLSFITSQLWLTDKNVVRTCVNLPRLSARDVWRD